MLLNNGKALSTQTGTLNVEDIPVMGQIRTTLATGTGILDVKFFTDSLFSKSKSTTQIYAAQSL